MTIKQIQKVSKSRADRWHEGDMKAWSTLEWAGAMAGEAGEACNVAKKIKRLDDKIKSINKEEGRQFSDRLLAVSALGKELADTILYAVCVASREGIDLESYIRKVFNEKSEEYEFPERL